MAATRPSGARPLPQPTMAQGYLSSYEQQQQREAIWYDAQERMRPSYIQALPAHRFPSMGPGPSPAAGGGPPGGNPGYPAPGGGAPASAHPYQQQPQMQQPPQQQQRTRPQPGQAPGGGGGGQQQPPLSPSAKYQYYSNLPPGAAAPMSQNTSTNNASASSAAAAAASGPNAYSNSRTPLSGVQQSRSYGPAADSSNRNSFSGLAALASNAGSRLRRHSNTNAADASLLAVPGQEQNGADTSWTRTGNKGSAFMVRVLSDPPFVLPLLTIDVLVCEFACSTKASGTSCR